ncbi:MAG: hypothetical protein GXP27_21430, partial [Planctomycetes bacterium]|nr:hypothetical protein [Planctomycetota bacterium]
MVDPRRRRFRSWVWAKVLLAIGAAAAFDQAVVNSVAPSRKAERTEPPRKPMSYSTRPEQWLKRELQQTPVPATIEPGGTVVTLRKVAFRGQAHTLGSMPKARRLTVQRVQRARLRSRMGGRQGWIDHKSVLTATLAKWYATLPDLAPVDLFPESHRLTVNDGGIVRSKIHGVWLELHGLPAGESPCVFFNSPRRAIGIGTPPDGRNRAETVHVLSRSGSTFVVCAKGHQATVRRKGIFLAYRAVAVVLEQVDDGFLALTVNASSYGTVCPRDFVVVDASGKVVVN